MDMEVIEDVKSESGHEDILASSHLINVNVSATPDQPLTLKLPIPKPVTAKSKSKRPGTAVNRRPLSAATGREG